MQNLSWILIYAFALPVFFVLVYILYKFVDFRLKADQETISPIFNTSENPVGLSKEELEAKKVQQKEAMKHLNEVIAKVPVELVDGKFVPMSGEKMKEELARREAEAKSQQNPVQINLPENSQN